MQGAHWVLLLPHQEVTVSSLSLAIEGMSCHHCLNAVNKALAAHARRDDRVRPDRPGGAVVRSRPGGSGRIIAAVTDAGYRAHAGQRAVGGPPMTALAPDAAGDTCTIEVSGMTCAACSGRVQRALEKTPGVVTANVNLMTGSATVGFDAGQVSLDHLLEVVRESGYGAALPKADAEAGAETAGARPGPGSGSHGAPPEGSGGGRGRGAHDGPDALRGAWARRDGRSGDAAADAGGRRPPAPGSRRSARCR